jgi:dienelactone hydrolase
VGFEANTDLWRRQFESLGISTFALDSFSGRGIVSTVVDQSLLGRLNMILDLYRSLAVLAGHPRIDPNRIAVMGFSRGGQAALYGTLKRFHKLWNPTGIDPAAYIALYPPCNTTYIGDTDVTDHPIQIFHGTLDDYVEAAPCRAYVKRLKQTAAQIQLTEYPDAWHLRLSLASAYSHCRVEWTDNALRVEGRTARDNHQYGDTQAIHI